MDRGFNQKWTFNHCTKLNKWLVLSSFLSILLLSSCMTGPIGIRNGNISSKGKIVEPSSDLANSENIMSSFLEKAVQNTTDSSESENLDLQDDNLATNSSNKKLPSLRQQLKSLQDDQATIKNDVKDVKTNIEELNNQNGDIRNSLKDMKYDIEEIKEAMKEMIGKSRPVAEAGMSEKSEQIEYSQKKESAKQVRSNKIYPDNKIVSDEKVTVAKSTPAKSSKKSNTSTTDNAVKDKTKVETVTQNVMQAEYETKRNSEDFKNALNLVTRKNYDNAIAKLLQIERKESNPYIKNDCNYWVGESYFGLNKHDKAQVYFSKVINSMAYSKTDDAISMRAESFLKTGKFDEARKDYENLIDNYPSSEFIPRARKMLQQL